jgi:hypothetical protein
MFFREKQPLFMQQNTQLVKLIFSLFRNNVKQAARIRTLGLDLSDFRGTDRITAAGVTGERHKQSSPRPCSGRLLVGIR